MKIITFVNNITQYENIIKENNINIICDENMNMIISNEDADKLMKKIICNEMDIIIEDIQT